jgi:hypothetical protein
VTCLFNLRHYFLEVTYSNSSVTKPLTYLKLWTSPKPKAYTKSSKKQSRIPMVKKPSFFKDGRVGESTFTSFFKGQSKTTVSSVYRGVTFEIIRPNSHSQFAEDNTKALYHTDTPIDLPERLLTWRDSRAARVTRPNLSCPISLSTNATAAAQEPFLPPGLETFPWMSDVKYPTPPPSAATSRAPSPFQQALAHGEQTNNVNRNNDNDRMITAPPYDKPPSCSSGHPSSFEAATGIGMGPQYRCPSRGGIVGQRSQPPSRCNSLNEFVHYFNPLSWMVVDGDARAEAQDLDAQRATFQPISHRWSQVSIAQTNHKREPTSIECDSVDSLVNAAVEAGLVEFPEKSHYVTAGPDEGELVWRKRSNRGRKLGVTEIQSNSERSM